MPPILLLAFANDRSGSFLRSIAEEQRLIRQALDPLVQKGLLQVEILSNATAGDIFTAFRTYSGRVKVFHYGGHAGDLKLLLSGSDQGLDMQGFARFLGEQKGLELAFINGCATAAQQAPLQAAGIPRLILTETAINDAAAKEFAGQFYQSLATGHTVSQSFAEAEGATTAQIGSDFRSLTWEETEEDSDSDLPWRLHSADAQAWSLPTQKPFPWKLALLAAGLLIAMVSGGFALWKYSLPFDMQLRAQYPPEVQEAHFRFSHQLTVTLPDRQLSLPLDQAGLIQLDQLTGQGANIPVSLSSPLWTITDSLLTLASGSKPLPINWKSSLQQLTGIIVDQDTQAPIPQARITLGNREAETDAEGKFELKIPAGRVAEVAHSLQAYHPDFQARSWTINLADEKGFYSIPLIRKE